MLKLSEIREIACILEKEMPKCMKNIRCCQKDGALLLGLHLNVNQ